MGANRVQIPPPDRVNVNQHHQPSPRATGRIEHQRPGPVLSVALHQQTQPGPGKHALAGRAGPPGCRLPALAKVRRVDGVGHPLGLPRATTWRPEDRATQRRCRSRRGLPPGRRVVGLRQADGMPHSPSVQDRILGRRAVERRGAVRNLEKQRERSSWSTPLHHAGGHAWSGRVGL